MSEKTTYPYSFEVYCKEHPEKFETRIKKTKKILYAVGTVLFGLIAFFPSVMSHVPLVSMFPAWVIVVAAGMAGLYCLLVFFGDCDTLCNIESTGVVKHIGHKKFDRVNTKADEIVAAFGRHDFDFLAEAAETENDPLQIYVYEDAAGKEFYLHLRAYTAPSEFNGASEVVTISGQEYDLFRSTIRSIGPMKKK